MPHHEHRRDGSGALLASAFVLLAILLAVAAQRRPGPQAYAEVASVGELTALTARVSDQEDIFCVLDGRTETLLTYRVENRNRLTLMQTMSLPQAFLEARGPQTGGSRRR